MQRAIIKKTADLKINIIIKSTSPTAKAITYIPPAARNTNKSNKARASLINFNTTYT